MTATKAGAAAVGSGALAGGAGWAAYNYLLRQAQATRGVIGRPTGRPPRADGVYSPGCGHPERWTRTSAVDLHLMIFGDSTAAGLGCEVPDEVPGVLLARGLAEETGLRVRLSTKAIVGATSKGLKGQVDAMFVAGPPPDAAVILIGANDVTTRLSPRGSAHRLGEAVARLHGSGAAVVVGTCPDLGVVTTIPQPLRAVVRRWGLRLAKEQAAATRAAGGVPVPLADLLTPEFLATPDALFSADHFHPSAAGYELAGEQLLPALCTALGVWSGGPLPVLPQVSAAVESRRMANRTAEVLDRIWRRHEEVRNERAGLVGEPNPFGEVPAEAVRDAARAQQRRRRESPAQPAT
ncbi:SGNH/GDSL hydrolase family protein [Speluncibacter jeojiensis]|uniref:SGNH/GDSL hydrolase family protein n=1 Tax=Speluncibacter jeojiensis TaxID=2710754 RepID=A0A9X4M1K4_9ACTN|nr:SGNH/GDSL hydrolase family protein [Rhodococcus sp. D2-41]MDG3014712.1 SGNH/GDSL hydrolase family protein [Corynebacteriales bacterium D3-21]